MAQIFLKDANALDTVGHAIGRMNNGAVRSMERRGVLSPDPGVTRHPFIDILDNPDLRAHGHNLLWCGLFLSASKPSDTRRRDLLRFFLHQVPRTGFKAYA
ncbi:MAG: hypothetical protein LC620_01240 [Halobacteriales archaeon]|nr:hypothetical protein [Halobacteriales archaeon]